MLRGKITYDPNQDFGHFLTELQKQSPKEWNWLIMKFRQKLIPFFKKRIQYYSSKALLSKDQFIEEVMEETLLQFLKSFKSGSFSSYSDLEATVVTIGGYKLKEGFARLKKEQRIYFMEVDALNVMRENLSRNDQEVEANQLQRIVEVKEKLELLPAEEKDLLLRFFNGEELQDIAEELKISAAACRKRKQRILSKLKNFIFKNLTILFL